MISPVVTFAIFTIIALRDATSLNVSRMFTSLSLILLLTQPLFYVFLGIEELMASIWCFERIRKLLMSETRKDHRLISSTAYPGRPSESFSRRNTGMQSEAHDGIELFNFNPTRTAPSSDLEAMNTSAVDETPVIRVSNGTFGWTDWRAYLARYQS